MTQEEKLKEAKKLYESANADQRYVLESLFPELKESEDEMIRKELLNAFQESEDSLYMVLTPQRRESFIAWLEKQGKQKPIDTKNLETAISNILKVYSHIILHRSLTQDELNETDVYAAENTKNLLCFLEQKPADKVEPKFRIEAGKWYICISQFCDCIEGRIYKATSDSRIMNDFGTEYDMHSDAYKYFRLWTIQDAKEGDVLEFGDHGRLVTGILSFVNKTTGKVDVSCLLEGDKFKVGVFYNLDTVKPHPATKEQRDLLFKKMKEAGYEWDAKNKELKKSEDEPTWSVEDETMLRKAIITIDNVRMDTNFQEYYQGICDWLESLRDRVQPQPRQEWSKEDESHICNIINWLDVCKAYNQDAKSIKLISQHIAWLKSLKERVGCEVNCTTKKEWSEEDNDNLTNILVAIDNMHESSTAKELKCWLKSLKGRVQPKQEWSEEDEGLRKEIVNYLECQKEDEPTRKEKINSWISWILKHSFSEWTKEEKEAWNKRLDCVIDILDWAEEKGRISLSDCQDYSIMLKSLRPQSTWKPCDYELEVLKLAAEKDGTCLMGLYEQLKKLREEVKND